MTADGIQVRRKRPRLFAQVPYGVARNAKLSDKALRLWVVLESYADYQDRDCYPSIATLAADCGACSRATVTRVQKELVEAGLLEIESGKMAGKSNVYVLIDPVEVAHPRATPKSPTRHRGSSPTSHKQDAGERHPVTTSPASPTPKPTDDPLVKAAHTLTVLAMEQPVKPVLRENGGSAFSAAMTIIERLLRAGESVQAIDRAIKSGIEVWTVAGIQTAIAQTKPRRERQQLGGNLLDLGIAVAKGDA